MKIVIKNKTTKIEIQRDQIIEVLQTADGIAFNMRNGLALIFTDNFMTANSKNLVKATIDQCAAENVTINIDLENQRTPASIMVNDVAPASKGVK